MASSGREFATTAKLDSNESKMRSMGYSRQAAHAADCRLP